MSKTNGTDVLKIEDAGRVRTLTLNRPDQLNAFNDAQYDALAAALRDAAASPTIAVVVITGAGRAFSAGQDLGELASPPKYADGSVHGFQPFMDTLQIFHKPLIASVNGIGIGIGVTMLLHCDLVLMAQGARLRAPFVSLGISAEAGSTYLFPRAIGWAETAHLLYTATWLSADDAVRTGIAWRAVPDTDLADETRRLAEQIAAMPITSLVATKKLLLDARLDGVQRARRRENEIIGGLSGGPANREAITAFREKRAPDFSKITLG
jgi:enoyl-CoA hydratase/carnithine racemase